MTFTSDLLILGVLFASLTAAQRVACTRTQRLTATALACLTCFLLGFLG